MNLYGEGGLGPVQGVSWAGVLYSGGGRGLGLLRGAYGGETPFCEQNDGHI